MGVTYQPMTELERRSVPSYAAWKAMPSFSRTLIAC